jgi:hypothetical protein
VWWAGAESSHIYIARSRVRWWHAGTGSMGEALFAQGSGGGSPPVEAPELAPPPSAAERALAEAFAALANARRRGRPGGKVSVWLSGHWARPFLLERIDGLRGATERMAVAQARAAELTGLAGPVRCWLEVGAQAGPTLAVAADAGVIDAVVGSARARSVPLRGLRPWWAATLNAALQGSPASSAGSDPAARAVAIEDDDSITVLASEPNGWRWAETMRLAAADAQRESTLRRKLFNAGGIAREALVEWGADFSGPPAGTVWPAPRLAGAPSSV